MSGISTHVLDTVHGLPAAGISIALELQAAPGTWQHIGAGVTDDNGRAQHLLPMNQELKEGVYRLTFQTAKYIDGFYPEVVVVFQVRNASQHYHVPLLLSPYGYTTYRGS